MDTIKPATFNTSLTLKKQTKKVNLLQVKNPSSPKKKKKKESEKQAFLERSEGSSSIPRYDRSVTPLQSLVPVIIRVASNRVDN